MLLTAISLLFVAGILLGAIIELPPALLFLGFIPIGLLFFTRYKWRIVLATLCLLALLGGMLRYQSAQPANDQDHIQFYNNQGEVTVKGTVSNDPETGSRTTQVRLAALEMKRGEMWQPARGAILIFAPSYADYEYGDVLRVSGEPETPVAFSDFNYPGYLASQGIYSTMFYPEVTVLETGKGLKPLAWLYSLRNSLSLVLIRVLPEPQASLAQGIILGISTNIPESIKESFSQSGTRHLLAISGLHLSIVAGMMLSAGLWLFGRRHHVYIWLALGAVWFYALLTAMHPPVIRGAIMASLFLMAELFGRQRGAITALTFAAAIMTAISPQILWTASFQMSFLAMAGLAFMAPPLMAVGRKVVSSIRGEEASVPAIAFFIVDSLSVTLAAVIAVWPVIMYHFGIISLVSLPATFFALPALPFVIIGGLFTGVLGIMALPLAQITGWLGWLFLSYLLLVVRIAVSLPFSSVRVPAVNSYFIACYYLAGLILLVRLRRATAKIRAIGITYAISDIVRVPGKWAVTLVLLVAVIPVLVGVVAVSDDKLHVSFLDVGQGDAILMCCRQYALQFAVELPHIS